MRERIAEWLTDDRLEPHLYLGGILVATAIVAAVLYLVDFRFG